MHFWEENFPSTIKAGIGDSGAVVKRLALFFMLVALGGCGSLSDLNGTIKTARGPNPTFVAADVDASSINEVTVIDSLVKRARLEVTPVVGDPKWYYVVPAGFSYVDEVCNAYLRALYDLDRDRDKFKSGITLIDKATSAILSATSTSAKAIQIVAQGFGMISGGIDAFVDRYEFKVAPSIVFLTLDKLRAKYRGDVAQLQTTIKSPGQAMVVLRGYLALCQPAFLESRINGYVAVAEAGSNVPTADIALAAPAAVARAVPPKAKQDAGSIQVFLTRPSW